jgi:hypothetical protein
VLEISEGSVACITAAVKIDDRSSKNLVETRLGILLVANLIGRLHCFEQALLNGIGRKLRIAKALARKAREFINVLQ